MVMPETVELTYRAFLSYSHVDTKWAQWLHRSLEVFRIDKDLVGRFTERGNVPSRLRPIFRDREEFSGGHKLTDATIAALDSSAALIVLCSLAAAQSKYVDEEVRLFKSRHPDRPVIPVMVNGTPLTSFPMALRYEVAPDGTLTNLPVSILAPDVREASGEGKNLALAKIVAGLTGLSTDEIVRRAERERRRTTHRAIAGLSALAVMLSVLLLWAEHNRREAVAQRNRAVRRQLLLSSETNRERYPSLAVLLARRAANMKDDSRTHETLFEALTNITVYPTKTLPEKHVDQAAISPDGTLLVVTSIDDADRWTANLWRSDGTLRLQTILATPGQRFQSVSWSPDSQRILIAETENKVAMWNVGDQTVQYLSIPTSFDESRPTILSWSPQGHRFISAASYQAQIWDISGTPIGSPFPFPDEVSDQVWSSDGKYILDLGIHSRNATIYDQNGTRVSVVTLPSEARAAGGWSPLENKFLSVGENSPVELLDLSGNSVMTFPKGTVARWSPQGDAVLIIEGDKGDIFKLDGTLVGTLSGLYSTRVSWTKDGARIIADCFLTAACIWNANGERLGILEFGPFVSISSTGSIDGNNIVTVSRDDESGDDIATIWSYGGGSPAILKGHRQALSGGAWSPDSKKVVTISFDGEAIIWDNYGRLIRRLDHGDRALKSVVWSADGTRIVANSDDGMTKVWSTEGEPLASSQLLGGNAVSPNGDFIVSVDRLGKLEVSDIFGRWLSTLPVALSDVKLLAWSPNGRILAIAMTSGTVLVWKMEGLTKTIVAKSQEVSSLWWSHNSTKILIHDNDVVWIYDIQEEKLVELAEKRRKMHQVAWSPNDQYVALRGEPGDVSIWNNSNEGGANSVSIPDNGMVLWRPDSKCVFNSVGSGSIFTPVSIWNVDGTRSVSIDESSIKEMVVILGAAWSPGSERLLTVSYDHRARLWNNNMEVEETFIGHTDSVGDGMWSPNGKWILTVSYDKTARIWPGMALAQFARDAVKRELSKKETEQYIDLEEQ
jgi:WD40 repeat protein